MIKYRLVTSAKCFDYTVFSIAASQVGFYCFFAHIKGIKTLSIANLYAKVCIAIKKILNRIKRSI